MHIENIKSFNQIFFNSQCENSQYLHTEGEKLRQGQRNEKISMLALLTILNQNLEALKGSDIEDKSEFITLNRNIVNLKNEYFGKKTRLINIICFLFGFIYFSKTYRQFDLVTQNSFQLMNSTQTQTPTQPANDRIFTESDHPPSVTPIENREANTESLLKENIHVLPFIGDNTKAFTEEAIAKAKSGVLRKLPITGEFILRDQNYEGLVNLASVRQIEELLKIENLTLNWSGIIFQDGEISSEDWGFLLQFLERYPAIGFGLPEDCQMALPPTSLPLNCLWLSQVEELALSGDVSGREVEIEILLKEFPQLESCDLSECTGLSTKIYSIIYDNKSIKQSVYPSEILELENEYPPINDPLEIKRVYGNSSLSLEKIYSLYSGPIHSAYLFIVPMVLREKDPKQLPTTLPYDLGVHFFLTQREDDQKFKDYIGERTIPAYLENYSSLKEKKASELLELYQNTENNWERKFYRVYIELFAEGLIQKNPDLFQGPVESPEMHDLVLKYQEEMLYFHSQEASLRAPGLYKQFQDNHFPHEISLDDPEEKLIKLDDWKALIHFINTGELELTVDLASSFLIFSNQYNMSQEVATECVRKLIEEAGIWGFPIEHLAALELTLELQSVQIDSEMRNRISGSVAQVIPLEDLTFRWVNLGKKIPRFSEFVEFLTADRSVLADKERNVYEEKRNTLPIITNTLV
ncbi:MAG: hypothetical protein Tsb0021_11730 [Chlamydiales bacterium]